MLQQLIEEPRTRIPARGPRAPEYERFGNVETRNGLQERLEIPLLLLALQPPLGGRVLEVGCGRGVALPVLAERLRPAELIGIDIDPVLVAIARERMRKNGVNATVDEGDLRELPYEDSAFDLVIDFGTCYHVGGGFHGARSALREIARVLRPGGLFIHETPIAQHLAHPVRSLGRRLPWATQPALVPERRAVLWSMRRRAASCTSELNSRNMRKQLERADNATPSCLIRSFVSLPPVPNIQLRKQNDSTWNRSW